MKNMSNNQKQVMYRLLIAMIPFVPFCAYLYYEFAIVNDMANFYGFLTLGTIVFILLIINYMEELLKKYKGVE